MRFRISFQLVLARKEYRTLITDRLSVAFELWLTDQEREVRNEWVAPYLMNELTGVVFLFFSDSKAYALQNWGFFFPFHPVANLSVSLSISSVF